MYVYVCIFISASLALKLILVLHCTFHIAYILPFTCYNIYIIFLYPILLYPILIFISTVLFFCLLKYRDLILSFYFMFICSLLFRSALSLLSLFPVSRYLSFCFLFRLSHFTASFPPSSLSISSRLAFVASISLQSLQCSNVPSSSSHD